MHCGAPRGGCGELQFPNVSGNLFSQRLSPGRCSWEHTLGSVSCTECRAGLDHTGHAALITCHRRWGVVLSCSVGCAGTHVQDVRGPQLPTLRLCLPCVTALWSSHHCHPHPASAGTHANWPPGPLGTQVPSVLCSEVKQGLSQCLKRVLSKNGQHIPWVPRLPHSMPQTDATH